MQKKENKLPAFIPALLLAATIAAADFLVVSRLELWLLGLSGLASLALRSRWARSAGISLLVVTLAMLLLQKRQAQQTAELSCLGRMEQTRFVDAAATVERVISHKSESRLVELRGVTFSQNSLTCRSSLPVLLILPSDAPATVPNATFRSAGLLSFGDSGLRLHVKSAQLIESITNHRRRGLAGVNDAIAARFNSEAEAVPERRELLALLQAVVLGRSTQLDEAIKEKYRAAGTYHLLVFSGMQITLLAGMLAFLLRRFGRPRLSDITLLTLACAAPLFAGAEPSVTRCAMMIGLYAVARLLGRPTSIENLYFVSIIFRLLVVPNDLYDGGFAMTYAATFGLIFCGKPLIAARQVRNPILAALLYGVCAELAILPFLLTWFQQFTAGGALLTLLIAPLFSLLLCLGILYCLLLFLLPDLSAPLLDLLAFISNLADLLNAAGAELLWRGPAARPSIPIMYAVLGLLCIMLLFRWSPSLRILLLFVIPLQVAIFHATHSSVDVPRAVLLDVGQGDAVLVRSESRNILVDGGGWGESSHFGRRILIPQLLARGVRRLDAVVLTHPHPDHCGGLPDVLRDLEVGELWMNARHLPQPCALELAHLAARNGTLLRLVRYSGRQLIGGLPATTLVPRLRLKRSWLNNSSLVCRLEFPGARILLTGDIEKEAELLYADEHPAALRAEYLKIPHHGSKTSSSLEFVRAVDPRVGLISAGKDNPFGHPHQEVLQRLRAAKTSIRRTDLQGAIEIDLLPGARRN